ncbi:MAG TPA: hypothetical protein VHK91_13495 [Flavisolibacter sp.]|jgi:hypothetical protein|nr:hypothetical protein [Flavisolibacter sp.]
MKFSFTLAIGALLLLASCKKDKPTPPPPVPPAGNVFLKDLIIDKLPSPYYHFDYDAAGYTTTASWSSGQSIYKLSYDGGRLTKLQNTTINKDRLEYIYSDKGQVELIKVINQQGVIYRVGSLTYDANKRLSQIEWELKIEGLGYAAEQNLSFTYYADGNLKELRDQRLAIESRQPAALYVDHFEQYDDQVNVEGFSLLHPYDRHLVLLPGIQLQRNNPKRVSRSGDGINYEILYTYTYNANKTPQQKSGDMVLTNGTDAGKHTPLHTTYTYY